MNLLSENDLKCLEKARLNGVEVVLERRYRDYSIIARTIPASAVWHPVEFLIQFREEYRNVVTTQNFTSAEKLKGALKNDQGSEGRSIYHAS